VDSRIDLIQQLHRLAEESVQVVRDTATAISQDDLRGKEWARKQVDLLFDELRNHYTTLLWADDDRMIANENSPRTAKDRVLKEAFQKSIGLSEVQLPQLVAETVTAIDKVEREIEEYEEQYFQALHSWERRARGNADKVLEEWSNAAGLPFFLWQKAEQRNVENGSDIPF
jgi:hypothetical protein